MNFFKTFLAAFVAGIALLLIFGLFLTVTIIGAAASSKSNSGENITDHTILKIDLQGEIVENASSDGSKLDFGDALPFGATKKTGLYQTLRAIERAKTDDHIDGIYLDVGYGAQAGWATLQSIRNALQDFKSSKKFIYAYSEAYTEKSYYIASTADSLFMTPGGILEFNGFAYTPMFYAGLFEKLELEPKIYKVGTFKSAVEPYILKEMSEANETQVKDFLGDIWTIFRDEVALSRKMPAAQIDSLASNFVFGNGTQAQAKGLIDRACYEDEVQSLMKKKTETDAKKKLKFVSLKKYISAMPEADEEDSKIAIIFAEGEIRSGKSGDGVMGSETIVEALRKAREDEEVKAVVLRVNSPGGSALASEVMTREVALTSQSKPIVTSMGDVAASGGYYISAKSDYIFAQENTITGSIGIFGILFNTQKLMNNKLGLTFDEVETHPNADFMNPNFPSSQMQEALMQRWIEKGYGDFLKVVQTGRKFPDSLSVDNVAQGRVWSGRDAKGIKLIDAYGNLEDAIKKAAELAKLDSGTYSVKLLPKSKNKFEEIFNQTSESFMSYFQSQDPLKEEKETLIKLKRAIPSSGAYTLMPATFDIK